MKKYLFIINPISGIGKQKKVEVILENKDKNWSFSYDIQYTQYPKHATEIAKKAIGKYDAIIAVGGDGSVNEVAKALIYTDIPLGIIPTGSGNGLARSLKIPQKISKALDIINNENVTVIDAAKMNKYVFFNVAGIGFDAHIGHVFSKLPHRGLNSYILAILQEFNRYKPQDYNIIINGEKRTVKAFLMSFANSSQFGNNAYISPSSKLNDGLIEICILKPFSIIHSGIIGMQLFLKKINNSENYNSQHVKEFFIENSNPVSVHYDGEPTTIDKDIKIAVLENALKVIVPESFKA